jgi:PAS domain S-box-containing protein
MKRLGIDLRSLRAQLILSFIALVLLTAAAVGLPAIWLIRNQLERQAWAQVEQGSRAAQALYMAQQSEIRNLARLTAQRPPLHDLLVQGEQEPLVEYLATLQAGAGLDLVLICDSNQQAVAQAGATISDSLCAVTIPTWFEIISENSSPQVWLLGTQSIDGVTGWQGQVIVGLTLDDEFAKQMRAQTGLEHTVLVAGQPVATSLGDGGLSVQTERSIASEECEQCTFTVNDQPYYGYAFPLPVSSTGSTGAEPELSAEVALAVADITATQQGLVWTLVGSIILVAVVGSVLGAFLARRINRPLGRLTEAATALSQGDLDSSMAIEAQVREIVLVSRALEQARLDLLHTLAELRQEKAWIDHLLEAIVEGIVTLNDENRITFFSRGAERITGWNRDEVMGRSCDEIFRLVETNQSFSELIPPPDRRYKIMVETTDGREATLSITGARLIPPETGDARVALVFRDVSEEEAVHRLMGHFLANVAHEFRTPLSAAVASIELLLDQTPDLNPDELQELLTSLHLGLLGLQTLVDNLLESASIEAGRFRINLHQAQLSKIIAEAIHTMQPLLDKHGQRLVVELPAALPVVRADPRRTGQVIVNLLSNASRYGPDDAEITVGATVSEGWVRITVADQGPGVTPEYRNDLFRRFVYPAADNDKAKYGAGLGLSVVKAVVEAHGGQVGVDDRPGGGSLFWFTLPVEGEE